MKIMQDTNFLLIFPHHHPIPSKRINNAHNDESNQSSHEDNTVLDMQLTQHDKESKYNANHANQKSKQPAKKIY